MPHEFPNRRPLKLLHIIASANPNGGGPIEGIIRQNEVSGHWGTRELVTTDRPDAPFLSTITLPVHALGSRIPNVPGLGLLKRYNFCPKLVPWLRRHARDYDAVVVNGLWNYAAMAAALSLPRSGVPYFVFPHGMLDPWFRRAYPLKHVLKQGFWLFNEGPLLSGARAVLFTTEEERILARRSFWPNHFKEIVVGYGTAAPPVADDADAQAFRTKVPALGQRSYLLFLSRIHKKKGCDLLIDAFASFARKSPDVDLVIAGPEADDIGEILRARAAAVGVEGRIHWPGMLRDRLKWGAFHGCDAFVLPSHQENFGIAVAEALACGRPVLITDKVNIWREVDDAGAGLVSPDTVEGVRDLLDRWHCMDLQRRVEMGCAAQALFAAKFDVRETAASLMDAIAAEL